MLPETLPFILGANVFRVAAESRTLTVTAETRRFTVSEDRTLAVLAEARVIPSRSLQ